MLESRKLVRACLRAPPVVADEAKLAIVFTDFCLLLVQAACVLHVWWRTEAKLSIVFTYFFFFFFPLRLLLFTHFGASPVTENLFPPILWHNQKEYKKYNCLVNSFFFTKKNNFQAFFLVSGFTFYMTIYFCCINQISG